MALTANISSTSDYFYFEDDDPEYWFLFPYFEQLCVETGQMVDLYGDAEFVHEHLLAFSLGLGQAEADLGTYPEDFPVAVSADEPPVTRPVNKTHLLATIDRLKTMANDAYDAGASLVFLGDWPPLH